MSGITPILDTLLHQVLGKRVDTPPPRELLEPVKPLTPGSAPRAVQADSHLDAQRSGIANARAGVGEAPTRPTLPTGSVLTPASTATHFSSAARTIADILVKFPAPPSVIQPSAPLLPDPGASDSPLLATRLQQSIESSGLFYESHLARWYRGDMAKAALEREPQMLRFQALLASAAAREGSAAGASGRGGESPASARVAADGAAATTPASAARSTSVPPAALPRTVNAGSSLPATSGDEMAFTALRDGDTANVATPRVAVEGLDDTLQGLIRHQLELLVTPTLRWEGDIWSGLFMALSLQFPDMLDERSWGGGEEREGGDDDPVWHSQLSLRLPSLGELDVQMHLRRSAVSLTLQAGDAACLSALKGGREVLEGRLRQAGFDEVRVSVIPATPSDGEVAP